MMPTRGLDLRGAAHFAYGILRRLHLSLRTFRVTRTFKLVQNLNSLIVVPNGCHHANFTLYSAQKSKKSTLKITDVDRLGGIRCKTRLLSNGSRQPVSSVASWGNGFHSTTTGLSYYSSYSKLYVSTFAVMHKSHIPRRATNTGNLRESQQSSNVHLCMGNAIEVETRW